MTAVDGLAVKTLKFTPVNPAGQGIGQQVDGPEAGIVAE